MALRMPVFGTPLGNLPTLSIKRYHQMQSVLGLASTWHDGGKRVTGWDTGYFTGLNTLGKSSHIIDQEIPPDAVSSGIGIHVA